MLKNNRGFSLVELLAMIVIVSFILLPLMTAFSNNLSIYDRLERRRNTVGIIDVMVSSIDRLNFDSVKTLLDENRVLNGTHYLVMHSSDCTTIFSNENDQNFCTDYMTLTYNNHTMDDGMLELYFFDYNLSVAEMNILLAQDLHPAIIDELTSIDTIETDGPDTVMRFIVLGRYGDEPSSVVVIGGVMASD